MPQKCYECDFEYDIYHCPLIHEDTDEVRNNKRLDGCPLIGLPEHHGDLIDRNDLIKESLADGAYGYVDTKEIYDAPTIVEAE